MDGSSCSISHRRIGGRDLERNRYALIFEGMPEHCNDCNTPVGGLHHPGCKQDICPVLTCNHQAAYCEHLGTGWPGHRRPF